MVANETAHFLLNTPINMLGDYVSKVIFKWTFNAVTTSKLIFMSSGTLLMEQLSYVLCSNML